MPNQKMISAHELAEILGLSVETVWRYTREKKIPYIELGPRQYRYVETEVLTALNRSNVSVVQEESPKIGDSRKLTYEDYAQLAPKTGYTTHLINGALVRESSPTFQHQRVSRRLQHILVTYFQEHDPQGEVFNAPLDIYFNEHTVVQPDLVYLPGKRPAKNNPVDSLPELVIEILSPSTAKNDRVKKLNCYLQAGVPHYWMVDLEHHFIEAYELRDNHFIAITGYLESEEIFTHPNFPGLAINVKELTKHP